MEGQAHGHELPEFELGSDISILSTLCRAKNYFSIESTMATTIRLTATARTSLWSNVKHTWKRMKLRAFDLVTPCVSEEALRAYELYEVDHQVRTAVATELRKHADFAGQDTCVQGAIDNALLKDGYDLSNGAALRRKYAGITKTFKEWDAEFARMSIDVSAIIGQDEVQVVPRFAAACTLHLRAKLGMLAYNEPNYLLVERKYLELCRNHGVRDCDIALHRGFVLNTFFSETTLDAIAASRRRLPAWVKWLHDVTDVRRPVAMAC